MGRIDVILPDDLEAKFRMEAGRKLGAKRGAFTEAVIMALADWAGVEAYKSSSKGKDKSKER